MDQILKELDENRETNRKFLELAENLLTSEADTKSILSKILHIMQQKFEMVNDDASNIMNETQEIQKSIKNFRCTCKFEVDNKNGLITRLKKEYSQLSEQLSANQEIVQ